MHNSMTGTDAAGCQEINIQNMNVELVAQMFKNYQSNVLFHLEGKSSFLVDLHHLGGLKVC